jgi:hypothetical protein
VAGIVDENVKSAVLGENLPDCGLDRTLRRYVELDRTEVNVVLPSELLDGGDLRRVAADRVRIDA